MNNVIYELYFKDSNMIIYNKQRNIIGTRFYKIDKIIVYEIANPGNFFNLWYTLNTLHLAKRLSLYT